MIATLIVLRTALVAIFAVAGTAKLLDRPGSRAALAEFGVPGRYVASAAVALPVAELVVAGALVAPTTTPFAGLGALALLLLFVVAITRVMRAGQAPDCHCFGQLHSAPAGRRTLIRNGALTVVAATVTVAAITGEAPSLTGWIGGLSTAAVIGLLSASFVAVTLGGVVWFGAELLSQHGRILARLDALERPAGVVPDPEPDPRPVPEVLLSDLDGEPVSTAAFADGVRSTLVVFSDPGCGPCAALLPEVAAWQHEHDDQLDIVVVSTGTTEANRTYGQDHGLVRVLCDEHDIAAEAFGVRGTPSAVLIDPTSRTAGRPATGAPAIRSLVGTTVAHGTDLGIPALREV